MVCSILFANCCNISSHDDIKKTVNADMNTQWSSRKIRTRHINGENISRYSHIMAGCDEGGSLRELCKRRRPSFVSRKLNVYHQRRKRV